MPKSLRLGTELEKTLDRYCADTGETKSAVIRQSLAEYIVRRQRKRRAPSAWELGKDLFGADRSAARQRLRAGQDADPREAPCETSSLTRGRLSRCFTPATSTTRRPKQFSNRTRRHW